MILFLGEFDEQGAPLAFINGIPARDMSAEEWAALSDEQCVRAIASGLYAMPAQSPIEPPAPQPGATFTDTQEGN